ncbi:MAG: SDR family oxidoreductase [Planctomycetota bacterium]
MNNRYLVIGGSHGIGRSLTGLLADQGHDVVVLSRNIEDLGTVARVVHHEFDVSSGQEIPEAALTESLAGLAYCVGSINLGPFRGVKPDVVAQDFALNVLGAIRLIQQAMPKLKSADQASIVLFSTVAVGQGLPMHTAVSTVKGAIEGLTRALAAELAPKIRVNCLAPSLTDTPLASRLLSSDEKIAAMGKRHPLGRVGTADDVASLAAHLLSDQGSWISGQVIGVDGGMSTLRV